MKMFGHLFCILLLLAAAAPVFAAAPGTPTNFTATVESAPGGMSFILLQWDVALTGGAPLSFDIFWAPGDQRDLTKFRELVKLPALLDSMRQPLMHYSYRVPNLPLGSNSFYMTASNHDGVSGPTPVVVATIPAPPEIHFTTRPIETAKSNVEYVYDADATSNLPGDIHFRPLGMPQGATLDTMTGVVRYTPAGPGRFGFGISAYLASDPRVQAVQQWTVLVDHDSIPPRHQASILRGTVQDNAGAAINDGFAEAVRLFVPPIGQGPRSYSAPITHGVFTIAIPDTGTFAVQISSPGFVSEWYDNKADLASATPLFVGVNDTVQIAVTLDPVVMYKISGKVTDATSGAGVRATVVAEAANRFRLAVTANAAGEYSLSLPGGQKYILHAEEYAHTYQVQFYNQVADASQATAIDLTADVTGIDFPLVKIPVYPNGISVAVRDSAGNGVPSRIMAFYFRPGSTMPDMRHARFGFTDSTGANTVTLANLTPGDYVVQAFPMLRSVAPGYYKENNPAVPRWQDATRITVTASGVQGPYTIQLKKRIHPFTTGIVQGTVQAVKNGFAPSAPSPIPAATLYVMDARGNVSDYISSDNDGNFLMNEGAAGSQTILVDYPGYQTYTGSVNISGTAPSQVIATMRPMGTTAVELTNVALPQFALDVYPNPVRETVVARIDRATTGGAVRMFSVTGQEIFRASLTSSAGTQNVSFSTGALPAGSYYISVETAAGTITRAVKVLH